MPGPALSLTLAILLNTCTAIPALKDTRSSLSNLDDGLQWKFADISMVSGEVYTGQVVGVYNEEKFMWNPTQHSTITVFTCSDAATTFADFSVTPGGDPAIFDLTTADIVTIKLREQPANLVEYQKFLRQHHH